MALVSSAWLFEIPFGSVGHVFNACHNFPAIGSFRISTFLASLHSAGLLAGFGCDRFWSCGNFLKSQDQPIRLFIALSNFDASFVYTISIFRPACSQHVCGRASIVIVLRLWLLSEVLGSVDPFVQCVVQLSHNMHFQVVNFCGRACSREVCRRESAMNARCRFLEGRWRPASADPGIIKFGYLCIKEKLWPRLQQRFAG